MGPPLNLAPAQQPLNTSSFPQPYLLQRFTPCEIISWYLLSKKNLLICRDHTKWGLEMGFVSTVYTCCSCSRTCPCGEVKQQKRLHLLLPHTSMWWSTMIIEDNATSAKNPELIKVPSAYPRVSQNFTLHASPTVQNLTFLISAFLCHSTSFFPIFPLLDCD